VSCGTHSVGLPALSTSNLHCTTLSSGRQPPVTLLESQGMWCLYQTDPALTLWASLTYRRTSPVPLVLGHAGFNITARPGRLPTHPRLWTSGA
jgi:hypothetical protein